MNNYIIKIRLSDQSLVYFFCQTVMRYTAFNPVLRARLVAWPTVVALVSWVVTFELSFSANSISNMSGHFNWIRKNCSWIKKIVSWTYGVLLSAGNWTAVFLYNPLPDITIFQFILFQTWYYDHAYQLKIY